MVTVFKNPIKEGRALFNEWHVLKILRSLKIHSKVQPKINLGFKIVPPTQRLRTRALSRTKPAKARRIRAPSRTSSVMKEADLTSHEFGSPRNS